MADTTKVTMRPEIKHYINGDECGVGWTKFAENPGAETEDTQYINMSASSSETVSYKPSYDIAADLMYAEPSIKTVVDIAKGRKIGDEAVVELITHDTVANKAWKESVAVAISSFDGEKKMSLTGTLSVRGDSIEGTYDASKKTFTPLDGSGT